MRKIAIIIVALTMVSVGFLSGCNEQTSVEEHQEKPIFEEPDEIDYSDDTSFIQWIGTTSSSCANYVSNIEDNMKQKDWERSIELCQTFVQYLNISDSRIQQYTKLSPPMQEAKGYYEIIIDIYINRTYKSQLASQYAEEGNEDKAIEYLNEVIDLQDEATIYSNLVVELIKQWEINYKD